VIGLPDRLSNRVASSFCVSEGCSRRRRRRAARSSSVKGVLALVFEALLRPVVVMEVVIQRQFEPPSCRPIAIAW